MKTATAKPPQLCKVALTGKTGTVSEVMAPAHWIGEFIAVTAPAGKDRNFAPRRGQWVITHRDSGLSGAILECSKKRAIAVAKQWDGKFGCIDATDARTWPWIEQWGNLVRTINYPHVSGNQNPDSSTATAGILAANAGIAIDQAGRGLRIQWRGKFWPAPTDAELDWWTFDSCAETPDGRTVEPDHPESWLRILRLV